MAVHAAQTRWWMVIAELRDKGFARGEYTQTTDVEGEINGLMTHDRKVIEISAKELAELYATLLEPSPIIRRDPRTDFAK